VAGRQICVAAWREKMKRQKTETEREEDEEDEVFGVLGGIELIEDDEVFGVPRGMEEEEEEGFGVPRGMEDEEEGVFGVPRGMEDEEEEFYQLGELDEAEFYEHLSHPRIITLATLHAMTAEAGTKVSDMFNELKRRLDLIFADLDRVHHSAEDVAVVHDLVFRFCTADLGEEIFYFFCEKCFEISLKLAVPYRTQKRRWIVTSIQRQQVDAVWLVFRRHGFPKYLTQHICEEFLENNSRTAAAIVKKTMSLARSFAQLGRWTINWHSSGALVELPDWGRLRIPATLKEMVVLIVEKVLYKLEFGENQPEDQGVDEAMKTAN
jgi:hypothetical protein